MIRLRTCLLFLWFAFACVSLTWAQPTAPTSVADPTIGVEKPGDYFAERHQRYLARGRAGPIGVLFLGDSITEGWNGAAPVWENHFGRYDAANFGISGDRTQHVLWRIEHGELDAIAPRVVVLMIGTNNTADNTAEQIIAANRKIIGEIRTRLPATRVLVLSLLPRGPWVMRDGRVDDWQRRMGVIRDVNRGLAALADGRCVHWLDLTPHFLAENGQIKAELSTDFLHLNAQGYTAWAESMDPVLQKLLHSEAEPCG